MTEQTNFVFSLHYLSSSSRSASRGLPLATLAFTLRCSINETQVKNEEVKWCYCHYISLPSDSHSARPRPFTLAHGDNSERPPCRFSSTEPHALLFFATGQSPSKRLLHLVTIHAAEPEIHSVSAPHQPFPIARASAQHLPAGCFARQWRTSETSAAAGIVTDAETAQVSYQPARKADRFNQH